MASSVVTGVVTDLGRELLAKSFGSLAGFNICRAKYFKIGMGGYLLGPGGIRIPKTPNPALTNIEATGAPGDNFFQKNLVAADFLFLNPSTMQVRCRLEVGEGNDDGAGNAPRYYELGLFDDYDNMIAYTTFGEMSKTPTKVITCLVQVYF